MQEENEVNADEIHSRNLRSELCVINRSDGSVKFSQGGTSVTCAVYGPVEVKGSREQHDRATLEVVVKQETGVQGSVEYQLEGLIGSLCEEVVMTTHHPRTAISVTVQINSNKGSVYSCVFNALCLALMDTSLPMTTTFSALTCGFIHSDPSVMLCDPNEEQEQKCDCLLTYVVDRSGGQLVTHSQGIFNSKQLIKGLGATKALIDRMSDFYRDAVTRKLSRLLVNEVPVKLKQ